MLLDPAHREWDDELLELFGVEQSVLPSIVGSSGDRRRGLAAGRRGVPIAGIAGDQQAALFGQACFAPGEAKATYGTGAFVLVNLGERLAPVSTVCCGRLPPSRRRRRPSSPPKDPCSSAAPRCSGCVTGSA